MNELGLTRESVRTLTEDVIGSTVQKYIQSLIDKNGLDALMLRAINEELQRNSRSYGESVGRTMTSALEAQVRNFVRDNVAITLRKGDGHD